jgi:predicted acylesterase/phospholipase RssA
MKNLSRRDLFKATAGMALAAGAEGHGRADEADGKVCDLALEGGGIKGVAFAGAVDELLRQGYRPRRLIGTSAGAIFATCLAAGYDAGQLQSLLTHRAADGRLRFRTFLDPAASTSPPPDFPREVWSLLQTSIEAARTAMRRESAVKRERFVAYLRWGMALLASGAAADDRPFLDWMKEQLRNAPTKPNPDERLKDFHERTARRGIQLSLIATDLTAQRVLVLNHLTAPDVPVVQAVRMSMGIPLVWKEAEWATDWGQYRGQPMREQGQGHRVVDGGVLSNFPLKYFLDPRHSKSDSVLGPLPEGPKARTLGLLLDETKEPPQPIVSKKRERYAERLPVYESLSRLSDTMTSAWDKEAIEEAGATKLVCKIGVKDVDTLDFDMTDDQLKALVESGRQAMSDYLNSPGP